MNAVRRQRLFWAIGMLSLAAAAGAFALKRLNKSDDGDPALQAAALPGFAMRAGDVTEYVITSPAAAFRLSKGDARWVVIERGGFPASEQQIQNLAAGLVNLKLEKPLTRDPRKFAALRLTDPRQGGTGTLIQANDAQGLERAALLISVYGQDLAVRYPGGKTVYLAKAILPPLSNPAYFADLRVLPIDSNRVRSVELIYNGRGVATLERPTPKDRFALRAHQNAGGAALEAIALRTSPFAPVDVAEAQPGENALVLGQRRITTFDGLVVLMTFKKRADAIWTTISAGGGGSSSEAIAINSRTSGWQFALPLNEETILFPASFETSTLAQAAPSVKTAPGQKQQDEPQPDPSNAYAE